MDQSAFIAFLNSPSGDILLLALTVWSLAWKGPALWKSARNGQMKWFIVMLILNTVGILEIVYLFYFSKPKKPLKGQNQG